MKPLMTLYSYRRCPFAIRVRMTLHEKGIAFNTVEENLSQMSATLKALHPEAKVPLLVDGDQVIYESAIITEYIDEAHPTESHLMPTGATERMQVRRWTYWCNNIFKPVIDQVKYGPIKLTPEEITTAKEKLLEHLAKLEERLSKNQWLVGDQLTLADIHVFPFFRQVTKIMPPLEELAQFPATNRWLDLIISRPSFEKTMKKTRKSPINE